MNIIQTEIPDILIIEPNIFNDARGFFVEVWNEKFFEKVGIRERFVQDNHSRSVKNTLRGLHYQIQKPQGKLVRVTRGEVFDVVVDLRKSSSTFGHWLGEILSEENKRMLWIPPGFAHGFYVVSEYADFQYKCTDFYNPEFERTIHWTDKKINIDWQIPDGVQPILSKKDSMGKYFELAEYYP